MAEKAPDAEPKKGKSKLVLIIVGAVVLLCAGGGTFAALKYFKKSPAGPDAAKSAEKAKDKKEQVRSTLNLDPFLVNLADKDEVRFVKASFRFGLGGVKEGEELGKDSVFLSVTRDAIISLLTSKTSDQILTFEGKEELRKEIMTKINSLDPKVKVLEVYIVDFVVQL